MSAFALTLVLSAAVLHASWNAMVKAAADRAVTIAAVAAMHAAGGSILIAIAGLPAPGAWPFIAISTVVHYLYYLLMFQAYRLGDLSQVYPISRGMAPALVALGTYLTIGETLAPGAIAGLVAITAGIALIAVQRGAVHAAPRTVLFALLLGTSIACYSVADGIGVRVAEKPLAYMGWLFLLEAPVVLAVLWNRQRSRTAVDWSAFRIGMVGGACSVIAYGTVLYAKTIAPIGAVSAIRESSVIIAALIGLIVFHERPWVGRIVAACVVAGGILALALS